MNGLPRNLTAVAMAKRYGGKGGAMSSRNTPRGGQRNEQRDYLTEWEQEREEHEDELARLRGGQ